jgi:leader peptidase (prepilin peptidase)/N-methyltransferase
MLVPDGPNFLLVATGLTLAIALPSIHGEGGRSLAILDRIAALETALIGVAVGTAATWWIRTLGTVFFEKEAMGEADIILCAGMGAFGGWQGALFTLFGGAIVGLILVLPSLIQARIKNSPGPASVPFIPSLAIAGAIWFFRGNELVEMWMNLGR